MKDTHIELDGKTYLSTMQAAEEMGYSKDYVGQLAREGRIDAKFIGRSWYVTEDSIREHKSSANYTLTKPKRKKSSTYSRETEKVNIHIDNSEIRGISREGKNTKNLAQLPEKQGYDKEGQNQKEISRQEEGVSVMQVATPEKQTHSLADEVLQALTPDPQKKDTSRPVIVPIRANSKKHTQDPLAHAEISFEPGEPLYYEDDRPARPQVRSIARFKGAPIIHDRSNPPIRNTSQKQDNVGLVQHKRVMQQPPLPSRRLMQQRQQRMVSQPVPMDGVRMSTSTQSMRRSRPQYATVHGRPSVAIEDEDVTSYGVRSGEMHTMPTSRKQRGMLIPILTTVFLCGLGILLWVLLAGV